MLVIQFKPFGAYPFLNQPVSKFSDKVIVAENIFGESILRLREQLLLKRNHQAKFQAVEHWLSKQFVQDNVPPDELLGIISKLHTNPLTKYKQVIKSYPKTQKHLIQQFKKYVGITPRYYQRIVRFNEILIANSLLTNCLTSLKILAKIQKPL